MSGQGFTYLQAAVHQALSADSALSALGVTLCDNVPDDAPMPYLVYGAATSTDRSSRTVGREKIGLQIAIYSQGGGRAKALAVLSAVAACLDAASFAGSAPAIGLVRFDPSSVVLENDGVTWRAAGTLAAFVEFPK